jgi:enoyl-CoA hydratase
MLVADNPIVSCRADGAVMLVTLDRPPLNVLNDAARDQLDACMAAIESDDAVRAVVIWGAGGRAFSVGSDVTELEQTMTSGGGRMRAIREHRQYSRLTGFAKPVVAAIEGLCLGGGFELALACDLRVATVESRFGLPEVRLGLFPDGGGTERLTVLIGRARAMELMLLGEQIDAGTALAWGILNRVVPAGEALDVALDLAGHVAEQPAVAVGAIKRLVDANEPPETSSHLNTIADAAEQVFQSEDAREGQAAFLEKREPRFRHR